MKLYFRIVRNPYFRVGVVALTLALLIAAAFSAFVWGRAALFERNPNFLLRQVVVRSAGWWNDRGDEVSETLGLAPGQTNIYNLDLAALRQTLKRKKPSIEEVELRRVLPDTLVFEVTERIPRAFLFNLDEKKIPFEDLVEKHDFESVLKVMKHKARFLVDGSGVVVAKKECVDFNQDLPVMFGFSLESAPLENGRRLHSVADGLEVLRLAATKYPQFEFKTIDLGRSDELKLSLAGRRGGPLYVHLPREEIEAKMLELLKCLKDIQRQNLACKSINLTFRNQAVVE